MPDATPRVIFRADGNSAMGLGHVVRGLALAAMLQPEFECLFAIQSPTPAVAAQIRTVCPELWELPADLEPAQQPAWLLARLHPTDIVVLDGYHFGPGYDYAFWQQQQPVVWLDDLAAHPLWADVIINHAGGVGAETYTALTVPGAELCLGPAYALLRQPFQAAARQPVTPPDTRRIFLNMGGADPDNHTLQVLKELRRQFPTKAVDVVTGAAYPHQATLQHYAAQWPEVTLHHNISGEELSQLLAHCGLHVCPPSGMAYECCAVGGLLLLYPIADNQRRLLTYLTEQGLARPYSDVLDLHDEQLPALALAAAQRQRTVFDGAAPPRLQQVFRALHRSAELMVRRAGPDDARQYFAWANDPQVRQNAIHSEPIEWDGHLGWFGRRLQDADSFLYIFERAGTPVGQVRVEFTGAEGTIDYSVDAAYRGQGMGVAILRRALRQLRLDRPGAWAVVGQVKTGNLPSCRVFQRLGFTQLAATRLHHETYEVFRREAAPVAVC